MVASVLRPFVAAITGTSESSGKLAGFPVIWRARLAQELPLQPEAAGPVVLWDKGHGGWTSQDILNAAPDIAGLRPNFILAESGDINDCFDPGGGPAISRTQKIVNMRAATAIWKAAIPAVDIVFRTANPVSTAVAVSRPTLSDYYADTLATATTDGLGTLDSAAAWPSPLPEWMCWAFDGLHPVWANAVEIYEYRAILFLFRQKMAAWWGLAAPVAPAYPVAPDVNYLVIPGGGAGGGNSGGGGGGAGAPLRGRDYLASLLGAVTVGAAGVHVSNGPGGDGGDSQLGPYLAKGGGGGGQYSSDLTLSQGHAGGASGGGGAYAARHAPGVPRYGQGFQGGASDPGNNNGAGGGGGACANGADGAVDGGAGGLGWTDDVPGGAQPIGGGGPGGSFNGIRPAYGLGGGPLQFGGGGRGGGTLGVAGDGDDGGAGCVYVWYPGAARAAGGVITTPVGFTVHKFTAGGALV